MNKNILTIGVVVSLVCIVLCGCTENNTNSHASIKDIHNKPESYLNETVVIAAFYGGTYPAAYSAKSIYQKDEETNDVIAIKFNSEQIDENNLILNSQYRFTGTVKLGDYAGIDYVYIEVTKVEQI